MVVLLPTVIMFFPALGLALAGAGAFLAVLLGLALLPVIDLLHPAAGGQQGLARAARPPAAAPLPDPGRGCSRWSSAPRPAWRSTASTPAHPAPTQLMYALDADTGTARWLSDETAHRRSGPPSTSSGDPRRSTDTLPAFGAEELLTGPAQAGRAARAGADPGLGHPHGRRAHAALRLDPQRPVRLDHPARGRRGTAVTAATVGRPAGPDRPGRRRAVGLRLRLPRTAGGRHRGHPDRARRPARLSSGRWTAATA